MAVRLQVADLVINLLRKVALNVLHHPDVDSDAQELGAAIPPPMIPVGTKPALGGRAHRDAFVTLPLRTKRLRRGL